MFHLYFIFCVIAKCLDPIQLLKPNESHSSLVLVPETLMSLGTESGEKLIHIVSIVGPYHSGKSFLLNAIIGKTNIFSVGPQTAPETMGLWLCRTNLKTDNGVEIWFIDSEGFFGPKVSDSYDAKIFTLALLLADELVYNTVKVIDAQAVQLLETLVRRAQLFDRTHAEPAQGLPHLTWVVEDFVQKIDDPSSYLRNYTETDYLEKVFPSFTVCPLFLPATTRTALTDLSQVQYSDLTVEFRTELEAMKRDMWNRLGDKPGQTLAAFRRKINFLAKAIEKGGFPELPSLWIAWQSQVVTSSMEDAFQFFSRHWQIADPFESADKFNRYTEESRRASIEFFTQLVADFVDDLSIHLIGLEERMKERHEIARKIHEEYVEKIIAAEYEISLRHFREETRKVDLLMNPALLRSDLTRIVNETVDRFEQIVAQYEGDREKSHSFLPAPFPQYSVHPAERLRREIDSAVETMIDENEKRIQTLISEATDISIKSVDAILLKEGKSLFSPTEFQNWKSQIEEEAGNVFVKSVGIERKEWLNKLDMETARGKINSEIENKFEIFAENHAQRLAEWIGKNGQTALEKYRHSKRKIETSMLPCDDPVLVVEHDKAVSVLTTALDRECGRFSLTEEYQRVRRELDSIVGSEFEKLERKNIQLWKVHSDEATMCAVEMNLKYIQENCKQGWLCLFKIIPGYHKSKSKSHLLACFDSLAKNMAPSEVMKTRIFDSWYDNELAKETAEIKSNMYIVFISLLVPVFWIAYVRYS